MNQTKQEVKAIIFKNFSDEDFTHTWDSVPYTFKAGQEMYMEDWKAAHFAKHLINRELNKLNRPSNDPLGITLRKKCLPGIDSFAADDDSSLQTKMLNKPIPDPGSDVLSNSLPEQNQKEDEKTPTEKPKLGRPKKTLVSPLA